MSEAELESAIHDAEAEKQCAYVADRLNDVAKELVELRDDFPDTEHARRADRILQALSGIVRAQVVEDVKSVEEVQLVNPSDLKE